MAVQSAGHVHRRGQRAVTELRGIYVDDIVARPFEADETARGPLLLLIGKNIAADELAVIDGNRACPAELDRRARQLAHVLPRIAAFTAGEAKRARTARPGRNGGQVVPTDSREA